MALETKVILLAILKIIEKSENLDEAYASVLELANADGITKEPISIEKKHRDRDKKEE